MENQNNLVLNDLAADSLRVSAKWTMFLSIVGFIFIGLMVLGGLSFMAAMSNVPDDPYGGAYGYSPFSIFDTIKTYIGMIYLVAAVVYFFPIFYLFKYSKTTKEALSFNNSDLLAVALQNLKSHHKYLGIMTIVVISLYILFFVGAIIFFASFARGM